MQALACLRMCSCLTRKFIHLVREINYAFFKFLYEFGLFACLFVGVSANEAILLYFLRHLFPDEGNYLKFSFY